VTRAARGHSVLILLTVAAFLLSLSAGKVWISPADWFAASVDGLIMAELRLPRALLGAAIGATLGLSGAVLQGYLRNPLADPAVVGISASAALGAVIAIFLGFGASQLFLFGSAMGGAALGLAVLIILAGKSSGPLGFILGGVILATLSGALTSFVISIAPNPFATSEIVTWLMGALTDRSMTDVAMALPLMLLGALLLATTGRALDAMTLGEDGAASLGIDLIRLRSLVLLGIGLCVGASVAVSGVIGFVGLIVPHIMRTYFGERPSALLLPSALGGAILTLAADALVRLSPGVGEVRLGIAMALIGAPTFLWMMLRLRGGTR
jgi:iron complex transport system permease protein